MTSLPCSGRRIGLLVLAASLHLAASANAATPHAYSLEARHFFAQPDDPNPVAKIYVSGDWHRLETYFDGKLRSTQIGRPDRNAVYVISESRRAYKEKSFDELRAAGWSPRGHPSLEEYREKAQNGKLVLTPLGSETINGQVCEKYSVAYSKAPPQSRFWFSAATGLSVLRTHGNTRTEWSNLKVGPQPAELFEPPRGYRKVRSLD